jgi:heme oxygenase
VAPSLADRLKTGTRDLHACAERAGVMGELLKGRLCAAAYHALLRNLHAIYAALEAALELRQHDPRVAPVRMPELYRAQALAADLQRLHGARWREEIAIELASSEYVARLQWLASTQAPLLVAHAYVRYLGDLHGGQQLAGVVRRRYGLSDADTSFYDFGRPEQVVLRRDAFRQALAAVPAAACDVDLLVLEARWAFGRHQALFEQLMGHQPMAADAL